MHRPAISTSTISKTLVRRQHQNHLNAFISRRSEDDISAQENATSRMGRSSVKLDRPRFAVKDNICTAELPTTCASRGLQDYVSPFEATVVSKLREDGGVLLGKTNLDEFGMGSHSTNSAYGPVRNARAEHLSAGGSSGGSAVAVASGECDWALGTDTGGSVRLPAAYNGIFGFKPSYGLLSRWGVVSYANSLDTVGILGKDVDVLRQVFDTLNFHDDKDPTNLSPSTRARLDGILEMERLLELVSRGVLRIGVPQEYNIHELSPIVRQAWLKFLKTLKASGAEIVPVSLPSTREALSAYYILAPAEASSNLAKYDGVRYGSQAPGGAAASGLLFANTRKHGFGEEVRRRILLGAYSLSAMVIDNYFIQAQKIRRIIQTEFDGVFKMPNVLSDHGQGNRDGVDAIVCPTAPTLPPTLAELETQSPLDVYASDVFTVPASLAGLPAISVPVEVEGSPEIPVGVQIITQYGADHVALNIASRGR